MKKKSKNTKNKKQKHLTNKNKHLPPQGLCLDVAWGLTCLLTQPKSPITYVLLMYSLTRCIICPLTLTYHHLNYKPQFR